MHHILADLSHFSTFIKLSKQKMKTHEKAVLLENPLKISHRFTYLTALSRGFEQQSNQFGTKYFLDLLNEIFYDNFL